MIVYEMRVDLPGDDLDATKQRARDEKAEVAYEQLSAGSNAADSAQIATELVHEIRDNEAQGRTITAAMQTLKDAATTKPSTGATGVAEIASNTKNPPA